MADAGDRLTFQVGDRTIWFGTIVEVLGIQGRRVRVRHVMFGYEFAANMGVLLRHRRGHWRGELIPEHRRAPTLVEPYVWSHVV